MNPNELTESDRNAMMAAVAVGLPAGLVGGYLAWGFARKRTSSKAIAAIVSVAGFNAVSGIAGRLAYVAAKVAMR